MHLNVSGKADAIIVLTDEAMIRILKEHMTMTLKQIVDQNTLRNAPWALRLIKYIE